jgi:hypothetical protein
VLDTVVFVGEVAAGRTIFRAGEVANRLVFVATYGEAGGVVSDSESTSVPVKEDWIEWDGSIASSKEKKSSSSKSLLLDGFAVVSVVRSSSCICNVDVLEILGLIGALRSSLGLDKLGIGIAVANGVFSIAGRGERVKGTKSDKTSSSSLAYSSPLLVDIEDSGAATDS